MVVNLWCYWCTNGPILWKKSFVEHKGQWVDSGQMFLGGAVGHSVIGNAVRINYGVSIPNDTILVASTDDLVRDVVSIFIKSILKIYQLKQENLSRWGKRRNLTRFYNPFL